MKKRVSVLLFLFVMFSCTGCSNSPKGSEQPAQTSAHSSNPHATDTSKTSSQTTVGAVSSSQDLTGSSSSNTGKNSYIYTEAEKQAIGNEFLAWADERATIGGMAVNGAYFNHGASGRGDWYARTADDQLILVQEQDSTIRGGEKYPYPIHALSGVVFYTSKYGTLGATDEIDDPKNHPSLATGFSEVAELDKPIVKYLLGDNGVVYEFNSTAAFSSGFYVTDDDGNFDYWPYEQLPFFISEDSAAQEKLRQILSDYK